MINRDTNLGNDPPAGFVVAVVDDDESILRSLGDLLESADYTVWLFRSATALLDTGRLVEIDCVVSDIDMPGMDGFDMLRLIHAKRPGMPIIFITGYPQRFNAPPLIPRGVVPRGFTKPFRAEDLLAAVGDAVRNTSSE